MEYFAVMMFPSGVDDVNHPGVGPLPGLEEVEPRLSLEVSHSGSELGAWLSVLRQCWTLPLPQASERDDDLRHPLRDVGLHDILLGQNRELFPLFRGLLVAGVFVDEANLKITVRKQDYPWQPLT